MNAITDGIQNACISCITAYLQTYCCWVHQESVSGSSLQFVPLIINSALDAVIYIKNSNYIDLNQ